MSLKLQETRNAKRLRLALKVPLANMFLFFNFIFFQLCIANLREQSGKLNKRQEGGRRGEWEGMDRQPVKNK